jgi:hypothetical protein
MLDAGQGHDAGATDGDVPRGRVAADRLEESTVRSLTILNLSGDSTLAWGPDNDALMRDIVERKMREGFSFFVMERRWTGLLPDRKALVTDIDKAMASRKLTMADDLFASIVTDSGVQLVRTPSREGGVRIGDAQMTRDPAVVASSQCVAVRHPVGG